MAEYGSARRGGSAYRFSVNWTRLTVREDLTTQTWDLWADGALLAAGLGFQYPPDAGLSHFFVLGDTRQPILLDDVSLSPFNPLGPDADSDGILDADDPDAQIASGESREKVDLTDTDADGLPDVFLRRFQAKEGFLLVNPKQLKLKWKITKSGF